MRSFRRPKKLAPIDTAHYVAVATLCDHEDKMLIAIQGKVLGCWIQGQKPRIKKHRNYRAAMLRYDEIMAKSASIYGGWTLITTKRKWRDWQHVKEYAQRFGYGERLGEQ